MSIHGGNITQVIEKYKLKDKSIIDFSANINPLGFPQRLKKIITNDLDNIAHYPDTDCRIIKKAISQYLKIPKDNLLIGNGSAELIFLITLALKPKKALIPVPTFSEYERAVNLSGGECLFLESAEKNNFKINIKKILRNLTYVDLVFICNPNNPTGFLLEESSVYSLASECEKRRVFLVIDEVYMDFVVQKDNTSMLKFAAKNRHIIVLKSFTKFFGLCGLRLGYVVGNNGLLKKISYYQPPWSVNSLAQLAGKEIIKDYYFIKNTREYILKERVQLYKELKRIKYIKPYRANANFIFCKLKNHKITSTWLCNYCARKGLIIRDCSNFRGLDNSFIRIAVRKTEENKKLIKILRELL